MSEENQAVNTTPPAAVENPEPQPATNEDYEARIAQLEDEKSQLIVEAANYKLGMLKAKGKEVPEDETEEERIRRITREELTQSKIAQIDAEKDVLNKKLAKEVKELKLALQNKTKEPSAALGTHSESQPVRDTLITADQMAAFKAKDWTDKDIERYKKNLAKRI